MSTTATESVYFLLLPGSQPFDFAVPAQLIERAAELSGKPLTLHYIGPNTSATIAGALPVTLKSLPAKLEGRATVFVPAAGSDAAARTAAQRWLATLGGDTSLVALGNGVVLLAEAGLLAGRRCTTDRSNIAAVNAASNTVQVLENRPLVRDRDLWTSPGGVSAVELALRFVIARLGAVAALKVARDYGIVLSRLGEESDWPVALRYRNHDNPVVHQAQDLLAEQPEAKLGATELAGRCGVSYRQLARLFADEAGVSVKQYQLELRIELARRLLADSEERVERIAELSGFASVQAFHAAWRSRERVSPLVYRRSSRVAR
ncbi:GlxA family transcriptional regulator [Chitinimonas lacunae]|uniref:GlxA family transcriptional regulator n=1 Tax=Chitinimonas lacunae TaxID=1963018 RepID=A0ABV8MTM9_9NEIS